MAFNVQQELTPDVQKAIGLSQVNCPIPRTGDKSALGVACFNIMTCNAHQAPFTQNQAEYIWNATPTVAKSYPTSPGEAVALSICPC